MEFIRTPIAGCYEIQPRIITDERGSFFRQFCADEFHQNGIDFTPVQSNYSRTHKAGTVRGLHFQVPPKSEAKLLRVLKGTVLDVCVDLRQGSETFAKSHAVELSEGNSKMFLLPKGCAHGFQTLTDNVEMLYFHDEFYSKEHDRTLRYDSPSLGIPWPLPVTTISEKDKNALLFSEYFKGLEL